MAKELENLRGAIDDAKASRSRLDGREEQLLANLTERTGHTSLADASKALKALKGKRAEMAQRLEDGLATLQEDFEW